MDRRLVHARAFAAALAALAAGCALAPPPAGEDLRKQAFPNVQIPDTWTAGPSDASQVASGWLKSFDDPALEQLVAEAMAYNTDLRVAAARVEAADAAARAAGATLLPQVSLYGRGGGKLSGDNSGLQGGGLFVNWELDLWGRVRATQASGVAQYEAFALDYKYARQSIAALVAKSWFLAREASMQRAIALEMVAAADSLADYSRDRVRVGNADELEVAQAEANALTYRDLVLQADLARSNALRAIEILAGRYPSATLDAGTELPPLPGPVPVGLPSQLLERRPDVVAAERRVALAFYNVEAAKAARLPAIKLTASVTSVTSDLLVLKEQSNPVWGVGGTLLAPIFTGGALQAQVEVRNAEQEAALAEYRRIGSRAFGEVENALSASFNLENRNQVLERAVRANEQALGFARVRYEVGSGDLRGVQQQMLALHAAQTSYLHVQAERLIQRVNLHLALGGGFEVPTP